MRKFRQFVLLAMTMTMSFVSCSKYDDTELQNKVTDLESRVKTIEDWCKTANGQIIALQDIVKVLEQKDFVTGVTPVMDGAKEIGYTITFTKSKSITIMHGKEGENGVTPKMRINATTKEWEVSTDNGATWTSTGEKATGHTPVMSVEQFEGTLYWKVDGIWLMNGNEKVPATGTQGDAIFQKDGIDTSDSENVTLTLADGTKITLPRTKALTIGFDSYEVLVVGGEKEITLQLTSTMKESDYTAIMAEVKSSNGTGTDIKTRASSTPWKVVVEKPDFINGVLVTGSAKVTVTPPVGAVTDETALLEVTIVDSKGNKVTSTRAIKYFDGTVVTNTDGNLSTQGIASNVTALAVTGTLDATDFKYIKENLTNLATLDLSGTTITEVPERAFASYSSSVLIENRTITNIVLPDGVVKIGNSAFAGCQALQEINIPSSVRTLGRWMFEKSSSQLTFSTPAIPEGVTDIPVSAFYGCMGLKALDIPSTVKTIGNYAFEGCGEIVGAVTIPATVRSIGEGAFFACDNITSVTILADIETLPNKIFLGCVKLKTVSLPESVETIGEKAFQESGIETITLPATIKNIGVAAFSECPDLTTINMKGVVNLGASAFFSSKKLSSVTLPSTLKMLGLSVFSGCIALESITLPAGITEIPTSTFANSGLESITFDGNITKIGGNSFSNCPLITIELPASITEIGEGAFGNCTSLVSFICNAENAPTLITSPNHPFWGLKDKCVLKVPNTVSYSSWDAYFKSIEEIEDIS